MIISVGWDISFCDACPGSSAESCAIIWGALSNKIKLTYNGPDRAYCAMRALG